MHTATPDQTTDRRRTWLVYGAAAFGLATALSAIGVFAGERDQGQVDAFPALVVFFGILTGLVFALGVRPGTEQEPSPRRVAVLGALAFVGIPVFWAGVPVICGVAALAVRPYARRSRATTCGVVLATVALVVSVVLAFAG